MLSDSELLCAVQTDGDSNNPAREEFFTRKAALLRYLASKACRLRGLHHDEVGDVVEIAAAAILNPAHARFNPVRANDGCEAYLRGMIQNAARTHARFCRRGQEQRHDWTHPDNARRRLPASVDGIRDALDTEAIPETRELATAVLAMADSDERGLVNRLFWTGESLEQIAASIGVDRSTVSRRLHRFYRRVREHGWPFDRPPQHSRN